jgi:HSP20 family protein
MLTRWDPFREMLSMRRAMDRLIENTTGENWDEVNEWSLALDVVEDENAFTVKATLPGVSPDDIDVTFNRGMLTIKGSVKDESETTKGQYHLRERRYGSFSRTISLPASVKAEDIQADYKDGVLSLTLPKTEEVKPKRIAIQAGNGQKVIEANSQRR